MEKNRHYYLQRHRLSDVIALIQVLALDEHTHRSPDGLKSELQGSPKSGGSWELVAKEHPEFFRFNEQRHKEKAGEANSISLVSRHVLRKDEQGFRELPLDLTKKLIETAIELHDKEQERSGRWKVWLPLGIALITVLSSLWVQYSNNKNQDFLKHYEVELKPKQEGYVNLMRSLSKAYYAAQNRQGNELSQSLDNGENNLYLLEPFVPSVQRDTIWQRYQRFTHFCYNIAQSDSLRKNIEFTSAAYLHHRDYFRTTLHKLLFSK
jgi:hypothetical protein